MKFKVAYIVKEMANKDFSDLDNYAEELCFIYGPGYEKVTLPKVIEHMMWMLKPFDPDHDLLVLNGANSASAVAFGTILYRYGRLNLADFVDGRYELHEITTANIPGREPSKKLLYTRSISPMEVSE